jgi:hypothetical protein
MLTKWMKEYSKAQWKLEYRSKSRRGGSHTNDMVEITAPFLGAKTPRRDTDDNSNLSPSGLRWTIQFEQAILGVVYSDPTELFMAIKEIICTRYSNSTLKTTRFELTVSRDSKTIHKEDSSKWVGFDEALKQAVASGNLRIIRGPTIGKFIHGGAEKWEAIEYLIPDTKFNLKDFPLYGQRRMESTRVHMAINGRFIEHMPLSKMYGGVDHNRFNGRITIIYFTSDEDKYDKLPTPATTKVAFSESCPIFQDFKLKCVQFLMSKENDPPPPAPPPELTLEGIPKMLLADLKYWCGEKGIAKAGTKSELVKRLTDLISPVKPTDWTVVATKCADEAALAAASARKLKTEAVASRDVAVSAATASGARKAATTAKNSAKNALAASTAATKFADDAAEASKKASTSAAKKAERDAAVSKQAARVDAVDAEAATKGAVEAADKAELVEKQKAAADEMEKRRKAAQEEETRQRAAQEEEKKRRAAVLEEQKRIQNAKIVFVENGESINVTIDGIINNSIPCHVDCGIITPLLKQYVAKHGNEKFLMWVPKFIAANAVFDSNPGGCS